MLGSDILGILVNLCQDENNSKVSAKMAKRRTRKQKVQAKHKFIFEPAVKGQFKNEPKTTLLSKPDSKKAKKLANLTDLVSLKSDIIRSLILASLVLGLEIMIYLAWKH